MNFFSPSKTIFLVSLICLSAFLTSCGNDGFVPKPRGYLRIDLPEKKYRSFDSTFPFRFEYPVYANVSFDKFTQEEVYWMNLEFTRFKGKIHLSYKDLKNTNLSRLTEDARTMVYKHAPKATGIRESLIEHYDRKIFGMAYSIEGSEAASSFQFYVTDSTHHFLRGALYFDAVPNNDSLQPVIDFIVNDIDHLIATLHWKDLD